MLAKHLFIPDLQIKPGVPTDHLVWIGKLIVEEKPDVIVNAGDHWDMPSLSAYDKGKRVAEGRRISADIQAGRGAMSKLLDPLAYYNYKRVLNRKKKYLPRMEFLLGNHEERLLRHIEANPQLDGLISFPDTYQIERWGWNVNEYLKPVIIDGIAYAHYFYTPNTGRPYGGTCHTKLKNIGTSFVQGHIQGLDMATRTTNTGVEQWGIVAGSCYLHEEKYKGPQANDHWSGVIILDNVEEGRCDPRPISLKTLEEKYGR